MASNLFIIKLILDTLQQSVFVGEFMCKEVNRSHIMPTTTTDAQIEKKAKSEKGGDCKDSLILL